VGVGRPFELGNVGRDGNGLVGLEEERAAGEEGELENVRDGREG
jgi:hypothetical protein